MDIMYTIVDVQLGGNAYIYDTIHDLIVRCLNISCLASILDIS